jgi:hypothetical protein
MSAACRPDISTDVPEIDAVVLESGEGMGPFGARGIGEPPIGPPAAAVASAIQDAVGVRPASLPMTPERVLECLTGARLAAGPLECLTRPGPGVGPSA